MPTSSLEHRVHLLERRSRLWGATALAAVAGLVLSAFDRAPAPGEAPGEVVAADRFELVDAEGEVRAVLGFDAEGTVGLFLRDAKGRLRAGLSQDAEQVALFLRDEEETIRVGIAQYAHGGGGFALHGAESKGAAVMYLKDRLGSFTLYDAEGEATARFPE